MNIMDLKFNQELEALRKEYSEQFKKYGHLGDTVMKIKVRYLCKRYEKRFEEVWKGK
jgi:hypothetical protein